MRETIHLVDLGIKFYREDYSFDNDLTATVSCSSVPSMTTEHSNLRVEVYWNLHLNTYSIRALQGPKKGLVVAHSDSVDLQDVRFVVQPAGNARVRSTNRKNVHAFMRGILTGGSESSRNCSTPVTYDPYKYVSFVVKGTEEPIGSSPRVTARVENGIPRIFSA